MTATTKKKLCWNCDGHVAAHEEHCTYCGVYLDGTLDRQGYNKGLFEEKEEFEVEEEKEDYSSQDSQSSQRFSFLQGQNPNSQSSQNSQDLSGSHQPLYTPSKEDNHASEEKIVAPERGASLFSLNQVKTEFLPLVFLLTGSVFFLFGLVLLLFSHEGRFVLEWDASLWFIYFVIAVPALFFGWRLLSRFSDL